MHVLDGISISHIKSMALECLSKCQTSQALKDFFRTHYDTDILFYKIVDRFWWILLRVRGREVLMTSPVFYSDILDTVIISKIICNILHEQSVSDHPFMGAGLEDFCDSAVVDSEFADSEFLGQDCSGISQMPEYDRWSVDGGTTTGSYFTGTIYSGPDTISGYTNPIIMPNGDYTII